jgi:ribosomal protein L16/L10AE
MLRHLTADVEIETVVFPHNALRQRPLSTIDGKPINRAEIDEVEERIEALSIYCK